MKKLMQFLFLFLIFTNLCFASGTYNGGSSVTVDGGEISIVDPLPTGTNTLGTVKVTNPDNSNVGSVTSLTVTGTANGSGQSAVTAIDVSAYKTISLQTTGTYSLTQAFQCSNDNLNWVACPMQNLASVPLAENTGVTGATNGIYVASINFKYFRDQITAYTSGTINTTIVLSTLGAPLPTQPVWAGQDGSWTMTRTSDYPSGATPITSSSGNVANSSAVSTLAGAASRTTYLTGFEITSAGATVGSVVTVTVVGTIGGTMSFTYVSSAGALLPNQPLNVVFPTPIPASAQNTAIVVTLPALGAGNTNATVVAHGYQL